MADSDKLPQIDPTEIEILIEKLEENRLEGRERRLILALLRTFMYIVAQLQRDCGMPVSDRFIRMNAAMFWGG